MQKVYLDTNIWLRFFLKDNDQFPACLDLISKIELGLVRAYTSTIVLTEICYIAEKIYQIPKDIRDEWIEAILQMRGLTLIEKTNFVEAFKLHQKNKVKLADCLIATQLPIHCFLATFDQDFKKLNGVKLYQFKAI